MYTRRVNVFDVVQTHSGVCSNTLSLSIVGDHTISTYYRIEQGAWLANNVIFESTDTYGNDSSTY